MQDDFQIQTEVVATFLVVFGSRMNLLCIVIVKILKDEEMLIWIASIRLTIVSSMVDEYASNGHLQLHIHFWPLGAFVSCLVCLANVNYRDYFLFLFLFSCVQVGVHMQKLEEVKVEVSSSYTKPLPIVSIP